MEIFFIMLFKSNIKLNHCWISAKIFPLLYQQNKEVLDIGFSIKTNLHMGLSNFWDKAVLLMLGSIQPVKVCHSTHCVSILISKNCRFSWVLCNSLVKALCRETNKTKRTTRIKKVTWEYNQANKCSSKGGLRKQPKYRVDVTFGYSTLTK